MHNKSPNMRLVILSALTLLFSACTLTPMDPLVYEIDIQQGNVVTQEMVGRLKPGMTRSQVRFIMGTPLVADAFHANRWEYVYRFQRAGVLKELYHVTVFFENDLLTRIEGDVASDVYTRPESGGVVVEVKPLKQP